MNYVFDACAFIAFLNEEDGAETVAELISQAYDGSGNLYISSIQVTEIYYDRIYVKGIEYAEKVLESIYSSPITVLHDVSRDIIREAAKFKTSYSISLADAFAAATAKSFVAYLVTKDDEFKALEENGELSLLWIK